MTHPPTLEFPVVDVSNIADASEKYFVVFVVHKSAQLLNFPEENPIVPLFTKVFQFPEESEAFPLDSSKCHAHMRLVVSAIYYGCVHVEIQYHFVSADTHSKRAHVHFETVVAVGRVAAPLANCVSHVMVRDVPLSFIRIMKSCPFVGVHVGF